ncbi:MAG: isoprenylcysteine carboxylmethyltransferase family protein [Anaerolineae bacterium]|nr:isoprenylcysteine carboxylmethyltransferase family protein [Anaerolineae bacterium]
MVANTETVSLKRKPMERVIDILAATFWAVYAAAYLQQAIITHNLMGLGLFAYYSLVVWLFINRVPAKRSGSWVMTTLALVGMVLPIIGLSPSSKGLPTPGTIIQFLGLAGMLVSTASLGKSFAIAPADRGLRTSGTYRWIRHPLYASELWFYVGYLIANWSQRNIAVLCLAIALTVVRIQYEEKLIAGYHHYARRVRWRLVPRVW